MFGISNVGKSVTGELLASRLDYEFYDLDEEVNIAITPLTYIDPIQHLFSEKDILAVELLDSAENIFDRPVFSDEKQEYNHVFKEDQKATGNIPCNPEKLLRQLSKAGHE